MATAKVVTMETMQVKLGQSSYYGNCTAYTSAASMSSQQVKGVSAVWGWEHFVLIVDTLCGHMHEVIK